MEGTVHWMVAPGADDPRGPGRPIPPAARAPPPRRLVSRSQTLPLTERVWHARLTDDVDHYREPELSPITKPPATASGQQIFGPPLQNFLDPPLGGTVSVYDFLSCPILHIGLRNVGY